ncbi:MAG: flagellin [Pirellulaceae bacterium]|nr:flagellin [Pirellulaceae bacterium]
MTRINTNVSSLVAQNRLNRNNSDLQVALARLSTGLRINTGKDDPAGLIASEALRSDIVSINKAISNTQRAAQIIGTADSALGQVSTILNTMRGLIVEAANSGAMSDDEIAANQLQIDSSLDAINRIAQTTTFQGRKLLDGSLDFISDLRSIPQVLDSRIDQANLGVTGIMNVQVNIISPATQAELTTSAFAIDNAHATVSFAARSSTILTDITVAALENTAPATIQFQFDNTLADDTVEADFDSGTNVITVRAKGSTDSSITKAQIAAAIDALDDFTATADAGTAADPAGDFSGVGSPPVDAVLDAVSLTIQAVQAGLEFNNVEIVFQEGTAAGAAYDALTKTLTIDYAAGSSTIDDIVAEIDALAEFSAMAGSGGANLTQSGDSQATANTELTGGGILIDDVVFELEGTNGIETFNRPAGTTAQQLVASVNLLSDAIGVTATLSPTTGQITFQSTDYGSRSRVAIQILREGPNGIFRDSLSSIRQHGTDIAATVNGVPANGNGYQLSINTAALSLQMSLDPSSILTSLNFAISGGGALFQLGGDVVSNQQARMGIGSVTTSKLGGISGKLYELALGQAKALTGDIWGASRVISEAINQVTSLRGRLGAFQATTLESNLTSLNDTVGNLTEAESMIRDADFAKETSRLTRAQILVQSNNVVLGIANQNPENVLRLLQ